MAIGKHYLFTLFALLFYITFIESLTSNIQDFTNFQIKIELLDPGPLVWTSPNNFIDDNDLHYYLRLSGSNLATVFPSLTNESSLTIQLFRDPLQKNSKFADLPDFDNFVKDQNGDQSRLDEQENSFISLFRGRVLNSYTNSSVNDIHSEVLAIGYIDDKTRSVALQAFINFEKTFLYIRPQMGQSSSSTSNQLHLISSESVYFFNLFRMQFRKRTSSRIRRSAQKRNVDHVENSCPMILYVDYSLFELMNHEHHRAIHFAHTVFTFANNIFLQTVWSKTGYSNGGLEDIENSILEGYGHTLCKIVIQEQPPTQMDPLYNHDRNYWPYEHLKTVLSNLPQRSSYCLAYLLTNLNILGTDNDLNGFAMEPSIFSARKSVPNVGAATFYSCPDPLDLHCLLNFAHELGHSWGASHDAHIDECIPPSNGTFLMSTPFLFTKGSNNLLFSPCSIRAIYVNIQRIDEQEFKSFCVKCGNGRVDEPEECDEGKHAGHCCSKMCTLLQNAKCSHFNYDCCNEHCQVTSSGASCRRPDLVYCLEESHCDGSSLHCPAARKLPDGTRCAHGGTCVHGYCNATCPAGKVQCKCPNISDQCYICCQEQGYYKGDDSATCVASIPLPSGMPCRFNDTIFGRCLAGYCEEATSDIVPEDTAEDSRSYGLYVAIFIVILLVILLMTASYIARKHLPKYLSKKIGINEEKHQQAELTVLSPPSTTEPNGNGHRRS